MFSFFSSDSQFFVQCTSTSCNTVVNVSFKFLLTIYVIICTLLCKSNAQDPILCSSRSSEKFEVEFYISTRSNLDQRYILNFQQNLTNFDFSPELNTAVIVHGFLFTHQMNPIVEMRDAFLQSENMNVITVDWSQGCNEVDNYAQAVANTKSTALEIKKFFLQLIKYYKKKLPTKKWGKFHFVGHSLGAHTVGQAAKFLENSYVVVHRVTGLDPAQPCFEDVHFALRLNANDARFVDVIHTNGEKNALGIFEPLGDVDFYVNGGKKQPGCPDFDFSKFSLLNVTKYPMTVTFCPHNRAMSLFTQSIIQRKAKQCKFWSYSWNMKSDEECNKKPSTHSCKNNHFLEMGISAHDVHSKIKTFCVLTSGAAPYCDI